MMMMMMMKRMVRNMDDRGIVDKQDRKVVDVGW